MSHPTKIKNTSPEELAKLVAGLRYDALQDFLFSLANQLELDHLADKQKGNNKLAGHLRAASLQTFEAGKTIGKAWKISKTHH